MATITLQGAPIHTSGELPKAGTTAPAFTLVDGKLNDVSLASFKGKKKILSIVPSLDTPVCAVSTQRFDEYAQKNPGTVVIIVSADLPFAQSRFCESAKTTRVVTLSMMRNRHFATDYGVLIQDGPLAGITARAVAVLDGDDRILYTELVPEIAQEPNYQDAIAALK